MKKTMLALVAVLALLGGAPKYAQASSDGTPSTGSFTVVNVSSLASASATGSLVVLDTSSLLGTRVSIGAIVLRAGTDYQVGASTNASAANLAAAINASAAPVAAVNVAGDNTVSLTAVDAGTLYNGVGLKSSNSLEVSTSGTHLTGGQDNASIAVNAISLRQGTDWFIQDVASNTAVSLAAAINNAPVIGRLVQAVPLNAVVYLRAILSPNAYTLSSSDPADLSVSGAVMTGGAPGNIAPFVCNLGVVNALPTANYPRGCIAYLSSAPTKLQLSTETVVGLQSWLAK